MQSRSGLFLVLLILVSPVFTSHLSNSSTLRTVDLFLRSCDIDPSKISRAAKQAGGAALACLALSRAREINTVFAGDNSSYAAERAAHWSATAWERPSCIYTPSDTEDVVFAVHVLGFTRSAYAIRSGGHSPFPSWANIDDGVLISMSNIKDFSYDASTQTTRVGFGNRWGDIYDRLKHYGLLVVGGRVPDVGLALTMGGKCGLSHLTNKYGFSADNVVSFDIVLANGTSVIASAISHPDLYWALKGGGNNFGIVTHMTLKTYSVGKVWGGSIIYSGNHLDDLLRAFATYQEVGQLDTNSALQSDMAITNDTLILTLVYFGAVERPKAFQPFFDIPPLADNTQLFDDLSELVNQQADAVLPRWTWGMTNMYLDSKTYVDFARICNEQISRLEGINGATVVLFPQPISKTMIDASKNTTGNPLGLRSRAQLWLNINIGWTFASDDAKVNAVLLDTLEKIEVLTKARNLYDPFIFLNDALSTQSVLRSYGDANFEKLQTVSHIYDPTAMFQYQVPGGFKLV